MVDENSCSATLQKPKKPRITRVIKMVINGSEIMFKTCGSHLTEYLVTAPLGSASGEMWLCACLNQVSSDPLLPPLRSRR